jgi:hypothetical protein
MDQEPEFVLTVEDQEAALAPAIRARSVMHTSILIDVAS